MISRMKGREPFIKINWPWQADLGLGVFVGIVWLVFLPGKTGFPDQWGFLEVMLFVVYPLLPLYLILSGVRRYFRARSK